MAFTSSQEAAHEGMAERKQKDCNHNDKKFSGVAISPSQNNLQLNAYF